MINKNHPLKSKTITKAIIQPTTINLINFEMIENENYYNKNFNQHDRIVELLLKNKKTEEDLYDISLFLLIFSTIREILIKQKDFNTKKYLLDQVSLNLKIDIKQSNSIICLNGERGSKFYNIINGTVIVFISAKQQLELTRICYIIYLLRLRHFKEFELLKVSLDDNVKIINYDESQIEALYILTKQNLSEIYNEYSSLDDLLQIHIKYLNIEKKIEEYILSNNSLSINIKRTTVEYDIDKGKDLNLFLNISIEDYCNRILPIKDCNFKDKFTFIIYKYHIGNILKKGDSFGEIALINENCKRTATCLAYGYKGKVVLGYLTKEIYNECMKEVNEKVKYEKYDHIVKNSFFRHLNFSNFNKYLSHYIEKRKIYKGEYLFGLNDNDQDNKFNNVLTDKYKKFKNNNDRVYFINKGDYSIFLEKSLSELLTTLKLFLKLHNNIKNYYFYENKLNSFENFSEEQLKTDHVFSKYFFQKRIFFVNSFSNYNIIGMDDSYLNDIPLYIIKCKSISGIYYVTSKDILYSYFEKDNYSVNKLKDYLNLKKEIILHKMMLILETNIGFYKEESIRSILPKEMRSQIKNNEHNINNSFSNKLDNKINNNKVIYEKIEKKIIKDNKNQENLHKNIQKKLENRSFQIKLDSYLSKSIISYVNIMDQVNNKNNIFNQSSIYQFKIIRYPIKNENDNEKEFLNKTQKKISDEYNKNIVSNKNKKLYNLNYDDINYLKKLKESNVRIKFIK